MILQKKVQNDISPSRNCQHHQGGSFEEVLQNVAWKKFAEFLMLRELRDSSF